MKKQPRYYQTEAVEALMSEMNVNLKASKSFAGVINAGPGAGKTLMMAMAADRLEKKGFNVLIMSRQPVLCAQNFNECWEYGVPSSMYAAKFNRKQVSASVVVGTEGTIANALKTDFHARRFDLILIDECHMVDYERESSQFMRIIEHFSDNAKRLGNRRPLQIAGMTGSPYRGTSSIIGEFWQSCVYDIGVQKLTEEGYLTQPTYGFADNHDNDLDFSGIDCIPNSWEFDERALNEIVMSGEGKKRLVGILTEVKAKTKDRNQIIIFASTKRHAAEVRDTLIALGEPTQSIGMVTDDTPEKERDQAVERSKSGDIRWLVNVSCLTTGFDSPLIDVVLFLRPVGSITLLMQCMGRAARLLKPEQAEKYKKPDYLVLDYAGVFDRIGHLIDNPIVNEARLSRSRADANVIHCPLCAAENFDTARRCIARITKSHQSHGTSADIDGRCGWFWRSNACPFCQCENDISAGVCRNPECKRELKDPNEKLLHKAYSDSELVDVASMTVSKGRGGALVVDYTLKVGSEYHGQPKEILFDVTGKGREPFRAWISQHVQSPAWCSKILATKNVDKILSFMREFRTPSRMAYRYNREKERFTIGRKCFD